MRPDADMRVNYVLKGGGKWSTLQAELLVTSHTGVYRIVGKK